jgi:DTW domain-containing protein YfiP
MNLSEYKQKKQAQKKQLEDSFKLNRSPCLRCLRPKKVCFCEQIKAFATKAHFWKLITSSPGSREGRLQSIIFEYCVGRTIEG